jgi:hypothetical protein
MEFDSVGVWKRLQTITEHHSGLSSRTVGVEAFFGDHISAPVIQLGVLLNMNRGELSFYLEMVEIWPADLGRAFDVDSSPRLDLKPRTSPRSLVTAL